MIVYAVINTFASEGWDSATWEAVDDGEHLGDEWLGIDIERECNVGILSCVVIVVNVGILIQLAVESGFLLTFASSSEGDF